jgi:hypothetical protein
MNDAQICTKSGGKSHSGSSRRRQGRDSRPRQQKSIKARETYIVNGLTPDFSHGVPDFGPVCRGEIGLRAFAPSHEVPPVIGG